MAKKYFVSDPHHFEREFREEGLDLKLTDENNRVEITEDQKKIIEKKYPYLKIEEE